MEKDKILIVEDEESLRFLYSEISKQLGYKPISYENGPDFMKDYKNHIEKTAVGIFDNNFPGPYLGLDLIREVTNKFGLYSILISGTATPEELKVKAFENGAKAFFEKPFNLMDLNKEIKKGIESKL